jgi:NAD(P)-dependent dehydrogenase (short-subunit alcohol dehydrogenase family)
MKLAGRNAIITGASLGLGAEIAEQFAAAGASLMLCARNAAELEAQRERLSATYPRSRILTHRADVSGRSDVDALFAAATTSLGKLDIVVNNAGVYGPMGSIDTIDWDEWVQAIAINLSGVVYCSRKAVEAFKPHRYGKIINLSGGGAT